MKRLAEDPTSANGPEAKAGKRQHTVFYETKKWINNDY